MSWVSVALALMKLASALVSYMHDNKMIEAGAAMEALKSLEKANEAIATGRKAREDSHIDSELHPERLRNDDGFKRPN